MKKKNYKGRCEKRVLPKCQGVCRTYSPVQYAFADMLQNDSAVIEFECNVLLAGLQEGEYTSDFVCTKVDGSRMVRECVFCSHLTRPTTARLLDMSRKYWRQHGVADWGLVIDTEKQCDERKR